MGKPPAIYSKEQVEFLAHCRCPGVLAEKFVPPAKLPAPVRRQIARVAAISALAGLIAGVLLVAGLSWAAWVIQV